MFNPLKFLPSRHDGNQEPAHRWLRCLYLLEHRRSPTPDDDALTHNAYAFLRGWQRCRNDAQREQLACAQPALADAVAFYQTASIRQRAELEARLLARQSDESIAGLCALSPAAVHLYHEMFFDVRPYLQADFYIFDKAIGRKAHQDLTSDDHDVLLKMAGYGLGPPAVDQLLAYWADPPEWPIPLEQLDGPALESLQTKLRMQAWILSLTIPADAATAARLPAIRQMLVQAGVLGKAASGNENSPLPPVHAALDDRPLLPEPTATVASDSRMPAGQDRAIASIRTGEPVCLDVSFHCCTSKQTEGCTGMIEAPFLSLVPKV